jgi:hypothetical protein
MLFMPTVFEKLQLKDTQEIVVLNAPESFEPELATLHGITIHRALNPVKKAAFLLAFITSKVEADALAAPVSERAEGDAIVWFAYPKGTSKKYKCDFNRDNGWDHIEALGFETVRAIAIDEDWSALRFRRTEFVKAKR